MAADFDPYRKWLGIPAEHRPPTHYQLLGLSPDETDEEVIHAAVLRLSAYVRNFQAGQYANHAARVLTEIAAAEICLLDPLKRAEYDRSLKPKAARPAPPRPPAPRAPPPAALPPVPPPGPLFDPLLEQFTQPPMMIAPWAAAPFRKAAPRRQGIPLWAWAAGGGGIVALAVLVVIVTAAVGHRAQNTPPVAGATSADAASTSTTSDMPVRQDEPAVDVAESGPPPAPATVAVDDTGPAGIVRWFQLDGQWPASPLAFSSDGGRLVMGRDGQSVLFDVNTATRLCPLDIPVWCCAFSPDGTRLLGGSSEGAIHIWNVSPAGQLTPVSELVAHESAVSRLAVSPDGKRALSGGKDGTLKVWDLVTAQEVFRFQGFKESVRVCLITNDGKQGLATDLGDTMVVVDLASGEFRVRSPGNKAFSFVKAFSADGRYVAREHIDIEVLEIATEKQVATFDADETTWALAFTPDGRRLVSGGNGHINVWDIETQQRTVLDAPMYWPIFPLLVSPDGRHVAAYPHHPDKHPSATIPPKPSGSSQRAAGDLVLFRLPP